MFSYLKPAAILFLLLTLLTGVIYPVLVTLLAQSLFAAEANGSLLKDQQGRVIGSVLIGQSFTDPKYFWGRPSVTAPFPYNAAASSGSNLGPTNPVLIENIKTRITALTNAAPGNHAKIPVDLVTSSASGLDPHISPAAADYQIHRVAKVRQLSVDAVRNLVQDHTEPRQWQVLGEARINVLKLNLALDALINTKNQR